MHREVFVGSLPHLKTMSYVEEQRDPAAVACLGMTSREHCEVYEAVRLTVGHGTADIGESGECPYCTGWHIVGIELVQMYRQEAESTFGHWTAGPGWHSS